MERCETMRHALTSVLLWFIIPALAACGSSDTAKEEPVSAAEEAIVEAETPEPETNPASILYIGHASLRITTPENRVIYIDPYAPGDYSLPADLILVTHDHYDHNNVSLVETRAEDCEVITRIEALANGEHQTFDLDDVTVEAVEAGNNPNHSITQCVGYVITLSDGVKIYVSGDTSATEQMNEMASMHIDYAFFCCDGQYNMGTAEAAECAEAVQAAVNVPYHTIVQDGVYFSREQADAFPVTNKVIIEPGETFDLTAH